MKPNDPMNSEGEYFKQQAESWSGGIAGELWYFFRHNKRWWLTPIVLLLLLLSGLVVLGGTGAAPLIYTLF